MKQGLLWDLLPKRRRRQQAIAPAPRPDPTPIPRPDPAPVVTRPRVASPERETMRDRYERITREMLSRYNVRVRKWRSSMSGVAWEVHYEDGRVSRLIEAPRPRGPMSAAVFLHEIGHHAIGFRRYRPRCLEEYHAWRFALEQMEELGLNVTDAVRARMHESLHYAVSKAARRGLKRLPTELMPYIKPLGEPVAPPF